MNKTNIMVLASFVSILASCSRPDLLVPTNTNFLQNYSSKHINSKFRTNFDKGLSFYSWGNKFVPIDIEKQQAKITFDIQNRTILTQSTVYFKALDSGVPYFALQQKNVTVDIIDLKSKKQSKVQIQNVIEPTGEETYAALTTNVLEGRSYVARFSYEIPALKIIEGDNIDFNSQQSDRGSDKSLAQFLPANYLSDKFQLTMDVTVKNLSKQIFFIANGKYLKGELASNENEKNWLVEFPNYMYSYGHFFHLTSKPLAILKTEYISKISNKTIPLTTYTEIGDSSQQERDLVLKDAAKRLDYLLDKYEKLLGEFAHNDFIFRLNHLDWDIGSMEYVGAMHSTFFVLEHEFVHNWFARGAMAGDNSGWIDEAVTKWLTDLGAYTSKDLVKRTPVKLVFNSLLSRATVQDAYQQGSKLLADLNLVLNFQLTKILSDFYMKNRLQTYTTDQFINHIYVSTPQKNLSTVKYLMDRYVFGKDKPWNLSSIPIEPTALDENTLRPGIKVKLYKLPIETYQVGFVIYQDLVKELITPNLNFEVKEDEFIFDSTEKDASMYAKGYLKISKEDDYKIILNSDDGSRVDIAGRQIVLNDWAHDMKPTETEIVHLKPGFYPIEVRWFDSGGGGGFLLQIEDSKGNKTPVDETMLFTEI